MNLERHLRVLWRYKIVVAIGLILGLALAFLASYKVSGSGLQHRGTETWASTSQVLVTQKGFPWGRVTLPSASVQQTNPNDPAGAVNDGTDGKDHIEYADPGRFVNLALLYSVISYSDKVRNKLPEHPRPDQIQATLLDPTNSGQSYLPIIALTTSAETPEKAVALNKAVFKGLREELEAQQKANGIKEPERVLLETLNTPSAPALMQGYSMTGSMLAFLLCLVATIALAHVLEGLRLAKLRRNELTATAPAGLSSNGHVSHHPATARGLQAEPPALAPTGAGGAPPPPPPPQTWR
jgi:hypothetical protein